MKITIDTTVDSQEDIRKVLQILHHVIDKKNSGYGSNEVSAGMSMFSSPEPTKPIEDTTNMMSMFSAESTNTPTAQETPDTPPDFRTLINLQNRVEEEKKEEPKLEFF